MASVINTFPIEKLTQESQRNKEKLSHTVVAQKINKETPESDPEKVQQPDLAETESAVIELKSLGMTDYMPYDLEQARDYSNIALFYKEFEAQATGLHGFMNSEFLASSLGFIVQFAVDELKLLGANYKGGKEEKTVCTLKQLTLEEKCTKPLFELRHYPTYLLGQDEMAYSLYKFELDRCFIEKLLATMSKEIIRRKSYMGFLAVLEKVLNATEEEINYLKDSSQLRNDINNIKKTRYDERRTFKYEMSGLNAHLATFKNTYEDMKRENYIKENYVDKWEKSRNRQNHVMYKQRIEKLEREIKDYQSKIERENRVNKEVERYTQLVRADTEKELVIWSARYGNELEDEETKIQSLTEMIQTISDELTSIKIKYDKQVKFIEEGRKLREAILRRKKKLANETVAAIKLQAWWRGVRVRRDMLGLLKKKKKRVARKDDKKGAKKPNAKTKGKK